VTLHVAVLKRPCWQLGGTPSLYFGNNEIFVIPKSLLDHHFVGGAEYRIYLTQLDNIVRRIGRLPLTVRCHEKWEGHLSLRLIVIGVRRGDAVAAALVHYF
jgi:hypothetical protein